MSIQPNNPNHNQIASILSGADTLTMSSREIAELTGKQHAHVTRDIRTMLIALYGEDEVEKSVPEKYRNRHSEYIRENADAIFAKLTGDDPKRDHKGFRGFSWERDNRGYISVFNLDHSHTMTLIAGYNVKLRKAIIDRWQELEAQTRQPDPIQVLNDPAAMRGLLLTYSEKVIALEATNAALTPKAEALDRISASGDSLTMTQTAKILGMKQSDMKKWMHANRWVYPQNDSWLAYEHQIKAGRLEYKEAHYTDKETRDRHRKPYCHVTPKGLAALAQLIPAKLRTEMPMFVPTLNGTASAEVMQ